MAAKFLSLSFLALAKLAAAANEYSDDQWANSMSISIFQVTRAPRMAVQLT